MQTKKTIDMTGKRSGSLTVVRRATEEERIAHGRRSTGAFWVCRCSECQQEVIALGTSLRSGHTPRGCCCGTDDAELAKLGLSSLEELFSKHAEASEFIRKTRALRNRIQVRDNNRTRRASP